MIGRRERPHGCPVVALVFGERPPDSAPGVRGNDDSSVNAVIPAKAGMTTRHGVAPKAITVIPAAFSPPEGGGESTRAEVAGGTSSQAGIHWADFALLSMNSLIHRVCGRALNP